MPTEVLTTYMTSSVASTDDENQFIPLSDDEETLWTVIEITAERPRQYKVRWEGLDPATGRPWAQSWVPKTDCTDDLRDNWKRKKAQKKERKGKGKSRLSKASATINSSAVTDDRKSSRSIAATPAASSRPPGSNVTVRSRTTAKAFKPPKRKFKSTETIPSDSDDGLGPEPVAGPSRPNKRRKVETDDSFHISQEPTQDTQESFDVGMKKFGKAVAPLADEFEEEAWGAAVVKPAKGKASTKPKPPDIPESGDEDEGPPPNSKAGPPRGVKKTKASSMKPRSRPRSNAPTTPLSPPSNQSHKSKHSKPTSHEPRMSPTNPLYRETTPHPRRNRPSMTVEVEIDGDHESEEELQHAGPSGHEQAPLVSTEDDEGGLVDQSEHPLSNPADLEGESHPEESFDEPHYERAPSQDAQMDQALLDSPSPEVPETQSQEPPKATSAPVAIEQASSTRARSASRSQTGSPPRASTSHSTSTHPSRRTAAANGNEKNKALGPIPRVSPSIIRSYHRLSSPRLSTPEPEVVEPDVPLSSIEEFSPAKPKSKQADSIRTWDGSSQRDATTANDGTLRTRGQELAREIQQRRVAENGKKTRRPLADLIMTYSSEPENNVHNENTMEDSVVQEMEDEFFDLSGGGEDQEPIPTHMRHEEEESTQDILRERQVLLDQLALLRSQSQEQDHDMEDQMEQYTDPIEDDRHDAAPSVAIPVTSEEVGAKRADPLHKEGTLEELPATLSPPRPSPHELARSQTEPTQSQSTSLSQAMNLLHVKSEEIANLRAAEARNATTLAESQSTISALQTLVETLRSSHTAAQEAWESERATLQASLAAAARATAAAEKDRDFFRDQYAQASGFVGAVRAENLELEKRVAIAEGQTKDGVQLIKATYVEQVRALQTEITQANWRAEMLRKQSERTGGDEMRRKASAYPDLLVKYAGVEHAMTLLNATVDELRRDRRVLKAKLEGREQLSLSGPSSDAPPLSNGTNHSRANALVYRCQWRPGGDAIACLEVFDSTEVLLISSPSISLIDGSIHTQELEKHMFSDQHLLTRAR
ncbi:hypothetical protein HWV62_27259 [Athelia sp. TMB]|nr:hypothetical protein HWV62_27259 [Athelia sp. TMB]